MSSISLRRKEQLFNTLFLTNNTRERWPKFSFTRVYLITGATWMEYKSMYIVFYNFLDTNTIKKNPSTKNIQPRVKQLKFSIQTKEHIFKNLTCWRRYITSQKCLKSVKRIIGTNRNLYHIYSILKTKKSGQFSSTWNTLLHQFSGDSIFQLDLILRPKRKNKTK